jgi:small subunit ribosomal protein S17
MERGLKKIKEGMVVSDKMDKTIAVACERLVKHPRYGKYIRKRTIYKAHDEKDEAQVGDEVEIMETRPLSKTKRWRLVRITKKSARPDLAIPEILESVSKKPSKKTKTTAPSGPTPDETEAPQ